MSSGDFEYNPQTGIIKVIGGEHGTIARVGRDGTFLFGTEKYVMFNYTTTLVKHGKTGFGDLDVKYFNHPMILPYEDFKISIVHLTNVLRNQIIVTVGDKPLETLCSLDESIEAIKNTIVAKLNNNKLSMSNQITRIVEMVVNQIKDYKPQDMVNSLPDTNKIDCKYNSDTPEKTILEDLIKYVVYHNNYHESIVENRGLSVLPDTIFLLTLISVILNAHNVTIVTEVSNTGLSEILIHVIIEEIFNIITMRLDKVMFIEERNSTARALKKKYYTNFPILQNKNTCTEAILKILQNNPQFMKQIEKESVQLFPYIALYSLSDKQRIKLLYTTFNNNNVNNAFNADINWLTPDDFITALSNFSKQHSDTYSRYDTNSFMEIVEKFITLSSQENILKHTEIESMEI
nr:P51 [Menippe mercenaria nudivirus]